jgi:hypothetical protein
MMKDQHIFNLEDGHIKIKGIYIGLSIERAQQLLLEQGFDSDFKGHIKGLGICRINIRGNKDVGSIVVVTERKFTEEETLVIFNQVSADFSTKPGFDYNDFGIAPKPHEINHFWDLSEGLVTIKWDGFNVDGFSSKDNDGMDHVVFSISGPVVKDEDARCCDACNDSTVLSARLAQMFDRKENK